MTYIVFGLTLFLDLPCFLTCIVFGLALSLDLHCLLTYIVWTHIVFDLCTQSFASYVYASCIGTFELHHRSVIPLTYVACIMHAVFRFGEIWDAASEDYIISKEPTQVPGLLAVDFACGDGHFLLVCVCLRACVDNEHAECILLL